MTVETDIDQSGPYAGAGTTGPFTVGFRFLDASHLRVVRADSLGEHELVLNTDYTVAGTGNPTGSVTLLAVLPVGQTLTIVRNVPQTQEANYVQNDDFPAESHEDALDKLTMITQQLNNKLGRAITFPVSDGSGLSTEMPVIAERANKLLSFDALGNPVAVAPSAQSAASVLIALAQPTGAALVGFNQAGTGAISRTVQTKLRETLQSGDHSTESQTRDAAVSARPAGFWMDVASTGSVRRVPSRLFIGDAVASSGNSTQTAGHESWLFDSFGAYWLERGAQMFTLPESPGYIGSVTAARTSTADTAAGVAIGGASIAWNDKTVGGTLLAWAHYFEAVVENGAGATYGAEVAVKNKSANAIRNPYAKDSSGGLGFWFAGGGDASYGGSPANPNNAAIVIGKNSHTWNTGICFDADGITGTDGVTGSGAAMKMAKGHRIDWFCDSTNVAAQITSSTTAGASKTKKIDFSDANVYLGNAANGSLFNFAMGTTQVNGFQFAATNTGAGQVTILADGADANLDLRLLPKGTGILKYGFFSAGSFTSNGCVFIKTEDGVTRRVLVAA